MYTLTLTSRSKKKTTRLFRNGNSQAVRIPAAFAFADENTELEIERVGEEIRLRPAARSLAGVLEKFAAFDSGFTVGDRGSQRQKERESL